MYACVCPCVSVCVCVCVCVCAHMCECVCVRESKECLLIGERCGRYLCVCEPGFYTSGGRRWPMEFAGHCFDEETI